LRPERALGLDPAASDGEPDPGDQQAAYLRIGSGAEAPLAYLLSIWTSARPVEQWEGMGSLRRWVETLALGSLLTRITFSLWIDCWKMGLGDG